MSELKLAFIKEVKALFKVHRRALIMMFLLPFCYTLLFGGMFYKNTVTNVPIAICDLDDSLSSRELITEISRVPELNVTMVTASEDDTLELFSRQDIYGVLTIPPDFSEKINKAQSVNLQATINFTNTVIGGIIMNNLQTVVSTYSANTVAQNNIAAGLTLQPGQVGMSLRSLYNSTGGYEDFFLSILLVHSLQIGLVFVIAPMFVLEKSRCLKQMTETIWWTLFVKVAVYTIVEVAILMCCLVFSYIAFGLNCRANIFDLLLFGGVFSFALVSFALFVGSMVNKPVVSITAALFYIMPSILLSGALWPRISMDKISLVLSYIMPIGYVAESWRDLLVRGNSPDLYQDMAALCLFGCIMLCGAGYFLRKKKEAVSYAQNHA